MTDGHKKCWQDACGLAEDIGLFISDNKPQLGDVCTDLPGVSIKQVFKPPRRDRAQANPTWLGQDAERTENET